MLVQDRPVHLEELGRDRPHARGGGDRERCRHVLRDARRRAPKRGRHAGRSEPVDASGVGTAPGAGHRSTSTAPVEARGTVVTGATDRDDAAGSAAAGAVPSQASPRWPRLRGRSRRRTRASSRSPTTGRCGTPRTCRRPARRWARTRHPKDGLVALAWSCDITTILPGHLVGKPHAERALALRTMFVGRRGDRSRPGAGDRALSARPDGLHVVDHRGDTPRAHTHRGPRPRFTGPGRVLRRAPCAVSTISTSSPTTGAATTTRAPCPWPAPSTTTSPISWRGGRRARGRGGPLLRR